MKSKEGIFRLFLEDFSRLRPPYYYALKKREAPRRLILPNDPLGNNQGGQRHSYASSADTHTPTFPFSFLYSDSDTFCALHSRNHLRHQKVCFVINLFHLIYLPDFKQDASLVFFNFCCFDWKYIGRRIPM